MATLYVAVVVLMVYVIQVSSYVRVCYFTTWSLTREDPRARITINDIDANLCTHLVYAFASFDISGKTVVTPGPYSQFNQIKDRNPNLKTLLSVGGESSHDAFSTISNNVNSISQFSKNVATLLRQQGFDGFDVDWEYPNANTKSQYTALLKGLREEFDDSSNGERLLLTSAVSAGDTIIKAGYDVPSVAKYLDYIFIMTYDFSGTWSQLAGFNSPLLARNDPRFSPLYNVDHAVQVWLGGGAERGKIVVGTTGAGASFTLTNSDQQTVGSPVKTGGGDRGQIFQLKGRLIFPEICLDLANGWVRVWDEEQKVPYAYSGVNWVGYDDTQSMELKAEYVKEHRLAGIMFWEVSFDDSHDVCKTGRFPLLRSIRDVLNETEIVTETYSNVFTTWRAYPETKGDNSWTEASGDNSGSVSIIRCCSFLCMHVFITITLLFRNL